MVTAAMKLRFLLLERKVMTNLDSMLKSRDITLLAKFHLVKAMVFPVAGSFLMESQLFASGSQSIGFSFSINPSNEYSGLISFRIDWLYLLAVQRTLKSLLQHHSSEALILRHSAFFMVQLSHPYMATGKTIALTRRTFVGKVMSLLFNMQSRLVITFLPRS